MACPFGVTIGLPLAPQRSLGWPSFHFVAREQAALETSEEAGDFSVQLWGSTMSLFEVVSSMDEMHWSLVSMLVFTNVFWWVGYRGLRRYVSALEGWRDDHVNRVKAGLARYQSSDLADR